MDAPGDTHTLRAVFHSSVHQLACQHYTTHAVASLDPSGIRRLAMVRALTHQPPMGGRGGHLHCRLCRPATFGLHRPFFCGGRLCRARRGPGVDGADSQCGAAGKKCMARLWADVGLNAKPFFSRSGFAVEARQQVALCSQVLANARMGKTLLTS